MQPIPWPFCVHTAGDLDPRRASASRGYGANWPRRYQRTRKRHGKGDNSFAQRYATPRTAELRSASAKCLRLYLRLMKQQSFKRPCCLYTFSRSKTRLPPTLCSALTRNLPIRSYCHSGTSYNPSYPLARKNINRFKSSAAPGVSGEQGRHPRPCISTEYQLRWRQSLTPGHSPVQ